MQRRNQWRAEWLRGNEMNYRQGQLGHDGLRWLRAKSHELLLVASWKESLFIKACDCSHAGSLHLKVQCGHRCQYISPNPWLSDGARVVAWFCHSWEIKGERKRQYEGLPGQLVNCGSAMIYYVCLQVSNSHGLRCMLPLLLGLVAISGLGALITCLASRFTMMMMRLMVMLTMMMMILMVRLKMVMIRLAFHNKAAILEHLHSLLLTASLLLLGLAILQVLIVLNVFRSTDCGDEDPTIIALPFTPPGYPAHLIWFAK